MKNGRLAQLQEQIVSLTNSAHGFMDLYYSERDAKQHVAARADAAEDKVVGLEAEVERLKHGPCRRWIVEETDEGVRVCRGEHERSAACEWEYFAPKPKEPGMVERQSSGPCDCDSGYRVVTQTIHCQKCEAARIKEAGGE